MLPGNRRVAASFACVIAASLLPGCDGVEQPTCVPPEHLTSCPECGPALVGAAVHASSGSRFARLPGNRTAVLGCGKVQYLSPDYSVEREATVEMTYPAAILAAGSGDETYLLDVERVHIGEEHSDDYLRFKYTVIALEGDGSERWRVVVAEQYDDVVSLDVMPGGVIADFRIDPGFPKTIDRNGVMDVLPVRRGVLHETGGFIEMPAGITPKQPVHVTASQQDGVVRWSKTLTPSSPQDPAGGSLTIAAAAGEPEGDTVIMGTLRGESLYIDDFVVSGGDPTTSTGFMVRLDPSGTVRWARIDGTLPYRNVAMVNDRVLVGTGSAISVADQSGVTPILDAGVYTGGMYRSTGNRIATFVGNPTDFSAYMFDIALP